MGGNKLKQHLQEIDELGPQFMFWQQLTQLAVQLEQDAPNLAKLADNNLAKILWINAIDWISQGYIRAQQQKEQPISQAQPTQGSTKQATQLNLVLLLTFMSFITLSIIMLKATQPPLKSLRNPLI
jgi:hypothetical protein